MSTAKRSRPAEIGLVLPELRVRLDKKSSILISSICSELKNREDEQD